MARAAASKFLIFRQVAEPLWLKEPRRKNGQVREDPLDASLFSVAGAVHCKWYKDISAGTNGRGAALTDAIGAVVRAKMSALHELFYKLVQKGGKEENNNFFKNHRATLVHYARWCEEQYDGDYAMDSAAKAAAYLEARAASVVEKKTGALVGDAETMFNAYRNAVAALERLALWQGYMEFASDLSKHEPVMVLRSRLFGDRNVERAAPQDYAATSRIISKRLNPAENQRMIEEYWSGAMYEDKYKAVAKAHAAQMRDLWFHVTQYEIGRRGQDLRALRYSMFMLHELDCVKPVKPCFALVASLRHAKEVTNNTEIPIAWVRAADREKCPIGATATNFVWQNDIVGIEGSSLLAIMKRDLRALTRLKRADLDSYAPRWRELFFIHSKNATAEISYSTHRKGVVAAFEAGNIQKTAKTQIFRTTRACELIEKGVQLADVGLFQGWWHDTAADIYLKGSIKAGPLLQAAGWDSMGDYHCWWESADGDIPAELLALVLPGLDEVTALAKDVNDKTGRDMSAVKVCEVLMWLRKVFIEDAAVHYAKYPTFPAYVGHPLFQHAGWAGFVAAEAERVARRRQAWEVQRRDPTLAAALQEQLQSKDDAIRELKDMVRELVATRRGPAPEAPAETVPEEAPTRPVPSLFDPRSMRDAYEEWVAGQRANFGFYIDAGIPIPWKEFYGDKANTMRQRWHKMKPWLTYMDDVTATVAATDVVAQLGAIAAKYRVDEGVFIKDAFYHLVHTPGANTTPRIAPDVLRRELRAVGLPVPEQKEKREYRKKRVSDS